MDDMERLFFGFPSFGEKGKTLTPSDSETLNFMDEPQ